MPPPLGAHFHVWLHLSRQPRSSLLRTTVVAWILGQKEKELSVRELNPGLPRCYHRDD